VNLDDFLDTFNWIDRIEGLASAIVHADWKAGAKGPPILGVAAELGRAANGAGSWTFHIPRDCGWTGADVEYLLRHYAVPSWGRRVTGQHFILSVPVRQANWAEYLILRRGIALDGTLFNAANQRYAQRYAPGDAPPAWVDRGSEPRSTVDRLADWLP